MTDITIITKDGHFFSIECEGHTGSAVAGEDTVCAGISSIVQTALLGVIQVAGINIDYEIDENRGYLSFAVPEHINGESKIKALAICDTMVLGIKDLYEQFSDFIYLEVIQNVY